MGQNPKPRWKNASNSSLLIAQNTEPHHIDVANPEQRLEFVTIKEERLELQKTTGRRQSNIEGDTRLTNEEPVREP